MRYYLLVFENTFDAIQTEKQLLESFPVMSVPTLRELSVHCGISLKISAEYYNEILHYLSFDKVCKTSLYEINGAGKNKTITFIQ